MQSANFKPTSLQQQARRKQQQQAATESNKKQQQEYAAQIGAQYDSRRTAEQCARFVGLKWHTRLTVILVGASILFSLFFGLEFLIAKLVLLLTGVGASASASCGALAPLRSQINWLQLSAGCSLARNTRPTSARQANCTQPSATKQWPQQMSLLPGQTKLGLNFELIYESDLQLSPDGRNYVIEEHFKSGAGGSATSGQLAVRPELKLKQLLDGHRIAMPFNPDIWTISRPEQHADLLTGHLDTCSHHLRLLAGALARALGGGSSLNETETEAKALNPLERVGYQHYQLMKLIDSFGRPESGTLGGHPFWLGSYLQCNQLNELTGRRALSLYDDEAGQQIKLKTRYCVGKLIMKSWLDKEDERQQNRHHQMRLTESISSFKIGLCLPNSCDSLALFALENGDKNNNNSAKLEILKEQIFQLLALNLPKQPNGLYASDHLKLMDVFCLPEEKARHLGACAFFLLFFMAAWLSCMIVCTRLRASRVGKQSKFAQIMAIDTNINLFIQSNKPLVVVQHQDRVVNLNVLNSVKHLGCIGVILAHVLLTYLTLGTSYNNTIEHIGKDMRTMLLLSLNNIVDTFFVISGLLISYLMFKKLNTKTNEQNQSLMKKTAMVNNSPWLMLMRVFKLIGNYLIVVFGRYARMGPLYFLVFTFAKTISVHLGAGPLWDYATNQDSLRGLCRQESWWWSVLFASDLKPITQHCVPPAWSISVDMQFFIVLPLFVALLKATTSRGNDDDAKKRVILNISLGSLIALCTLFTLIQYQSLLDYVSQRDFAKLRLHVFTVLIRHAAHAYSQPQNRMGPILIGLIGGQLLYEYETRHQTSCMKSKTKQENNESHEKNNSNYNNVKWPIWMRGKWFKFILSINLLFILAPCLVQLRERARRQLIINQIDNDEEMFKHHDLFSLDWMLARNAIRWLLHLGTSIKFDCYLALGGFVLIKPLWSLCNCIIFLRMATDLNGTYLAKLMSLNCWQIISKLNYAILLIHFELIAYESMSRLSMAQPITWSYLLCKFAFAYLFSLLLAVPLYILFEQPANALIIHYLLPVGRRQQQQQQQKLNTSNKWKQSKIIQKAKQ